MRLRSAALAAFVAVCAVAFPTHAADPLTLDDAFLRVADAHPDLRLFGARHEALKAELDRSSLRPALVAGAEVENVLGTGPASGLDGAEITLSLASVLERGGKLDARRTLAQSRIDALAIEREAQRLDLLAEVARRYLAVVGAQREGELAQLGVDQRDRTVAAARRRHGLALRPSRSYSPPRPPSRGRNWIALAPGNVRRPPASISRPCGASEIPHSRSSGAICSPCPRSRTSRYSPTGCNALPSSRSSSISSALARHACSWHAAKRPRTSTGRWACDGWRTAMTSAWSAVSRSRWAPAAGHNRASVPHAPS